MKTTIDLTQNKFIKYVWILLIVVVSSSFKGIIRQSTGGDPLIEKEVSLKIVNKFSVKGSIKLITLKMRIPVTKKNKQTVNSLNFSIQPDSIYRKENNTYAVFRFHDVTESFKLEITGDITIYNMINTQNEDTNVNFAKYLMPEKFIESNNRDIKNAAKQVKGKNDIETVINTFAFVDSSVKYKRNESIGAAEVLESGVGKCTDFSDLFVAMLRANKMPAKTMHGIVVDSRDKNPLHQWSEVYLQKQGWVRFDPTFRSAIYKVDKHYEMNLKNTYIETGEGRNDSELGEHAIIFNYVSNSYEGEVKQKISFDVVSKQ